MYIVAMPIFTSLFILKLAFSIRAFGYKVTQGYSTKVSLFLSKFGPFNRIKAFKTPSANEHQVILLQARALTSASTSRTRTNIEWFCFLNVHRHVRASIWCWSFSFGLMYPRAYTLITKNGTNNAFLSSRMRFHPDLVALLKASVFLPSSCFFN